MRSVSLAVTVVLVALGLSDGAGPVLQAQQPATPRVPAGQGGTIGGGVSSPDSPRQPRQPQRPMRDPRPPAAEGTATVRGRVIDAATGAAIPRAKVRYSGGRDSRNARVVTTDTEGAFTLTKVQAGTLILSAEKPTYLQTTYPERRGTMRGSAVRIADGQTIENITIPLYRGGAISGRLVDAYGDPAEGVMLHAIPASQKSNGVLFRGFQRSFQGTNDIGEYRISRLEPGQYYLLATPTRRSLNEEDTSSALGRTFYPGVASMEQAQPITIDRGQTIAGLDFQLLETTLTRVTGFVLTSKGSPATRGHVSVRASGPIKNMPPAGMGFGGGGGVDNGMFELTLQPGDYVLEAYASGDNLPSFNSSEMDRGELRLTVGAEPISGVTITTGRGGTISGKFVFNGRGAPPTNFQGFNIGFTGPNGGGMGEDCRAFNRPTVNPDGTFTAENMWGACQIRGGGMTKGWAFEAVMHNGTNITNRVVEFSNTRSLIGVEIVYTDRVGDLALTVSDDRGTPVQDYVAMAFPVEKEKWGDQRFMRFQVRSAESTPGGDPSSVSGSRVMPTQSLVGPGERYAGMVNTTFMAPGAVTSSGNNFNSLLAGDYFVVALEDSAPENLRDPEFFERLSQIATRVSVGPGGAESIQLRRVTLPQN